MAPERLLIIASGILDYKMLEAISNCHGYNHVRVDVPSTPWPGHPREMLTKADFPTMQSVLLKETAKQIRALPIDDGRVALINACPADSRLVRAQWKVNQGELTWAEYDEAVKEAEEEFEMARRLFSTTLHVVFGGEMHCTKASELEQVRKGSTAMTDEQRQFYLNAYRTTVIQACNDATYCWWSQLIKKFPGGPTVDGILKVAIQGWWMTIQQQRQRDELLRDGNTDSDESPPPPPVQDVAEHAFINEARRNLDEHTITEAGPKIWGGIW